MPKQCLSCGGIYEPVLPDGMRYFHVCPPVVAQLRVRRAGGIATIVPGAALPGDEEVDRVFAERPDKRDETVLGDAQGNPRPRSEGKGVRDVTP